MESEEIRSKMQKVVDFLIEDLKLLAGWSSQSFSYRKNNG